MSKKLWQLVCLLFRVYNSGPVLIISLSGVDIICAQGGEGGGHTGDTPFSILIPAVVDICRGRKSPLTGRDVIVVAAGGIADGRGLAAALS